MSFILDALRKSESERQRGALPGIAQVPFAAPRPSLPRWALAVIGALGLAVIGLAGAWWAQARTPPAQATAAAPLRLPAPDDRTSPAATIAAELRLPPRGAPSAAEPVQPAVPPPAARGPDANGPAAPSAGRSLAEIAEPAPAPPASTPRIAPESRAAAPPEPEAAPRAPEPAAASAAQLLPSAAALAAEGVPVPELTLDLHVFYRDRPADRLVIINGQRYREGEMLREGVYLEAIEPVGAVLSQRGRRFLLTAQ